MPASSRPIPRIGSFLVELERLERAQRPGVFLVDRLEATPHGITLHAPTGVQVLLPPDASTTAIGEALRVSIPDLQIPAADNETPLSVEPDVQTQWAQLHYALGAYQNAILADAHVRVLAVERRGSRATVQVLRGTNHDPESYWLDLDREIDLGLADTLAPAPAYGRVDGSLNFPDLASHRPDPETR